MSKKQKSMMEIAHEKAGLEGAGMIDTCEHCDKTIFDDEWYEHDDSGVYWHMRCDWRENIRGYVDERDALRKEVGELQAKLQKRKGKP